MLKTQPENTALDLAGELLALDPGIRYVALAQGDLLTTVAREGPAGASSAESDRFEELLVNPTILGLAGRRGAIDCGGLLFFVARYGHFFQLVLPLADGHLSVCIELSANVLQLAGRIRERMGLSWPAAEPGAALLEDPRVVLPEDAEMPAAARTGYALSPEIRYVAVRLGERLVLTSRVAADATSGTSTDRYEELLVNPTLLTIAGQRGAIDCGGLHYLVLRYGLFFAAALPLPGGHITLSFPPESDPFGFDDALLRLPRGYSLSG
jgi:hypothetical protein